MYGHLNFGNSSHLWKRAGQGEGLLENPIASFPDELEAIFLPRSSRGLFADDARRPYKDIHAAGEKYIHGGKLGQGVHAGTQESAGADVLSGDDFLPGVAGRV